MLKTNKLILLTCFISLILLTSCFNNDREDPIITKPPIDPPVESDFQFGADLSYVNQILDHGGKYLDNDVVVNPYKIFKDRGTNLVRLRLWHNPIWTLNVYDPAGTQMYNDLLDVEKAIKLSKEQGMKVLLDFHYSDRWTDPSYQYIPAAWTDIRDIGVLKDSVYNYTLKTLSYLESKGLMPEYVQLGNEINCGMLISSIPTGFPDCNICNDGLANLSAVLNSGINAVRKVASEAGIETKIIIHIANPVNVNWWFESIISGGVTDFDIIGFSYYPLWHKDIPISQLAETVAGFKTKFKKDVMILEVAYPWTTEGNDNYANVFGGDEVISGYPITPEGQLNLMKTITQNLMDGGAIGLVYWEPGWITSNMNDLWNTGSSWENNAFFDFDGNANQAFDYQTFEYTK